MISGLSILEAWVVGMMAGIIVLLGFVIVWQISTDPLGAVIVVGLLTAVPYIIGRAILEVDI